MHASSLTYQVPGINWDPWRKSSGVVPPPMAGFEFQELALVQRANSNRNPDAVAWTEFLDKRGGFKIWNDFAKQYRKRVGFVRGWAGTGMMYAALAANAVTSTRAKRHYNRLRPYQVDQRISVIGKAPKNRSYPSGHSSSAYSAATVLGMLWPARAQEFRWWARQVAMSRVHAGVHFPSDVVAGAELGTRNGLRTMSVLF